MCPGSYLLVIDRVYSPPTCGGTRIDADADAVAPY
jgi:hypothetical protein